MSKVELATWNILRERLQTTIAKESFDTWFQHLQLVDWRNRKLRLLAPNRYVKHWIESHYRDELFAAAHAVLPDTEVIEVGAATESEPGARAASPIGEIIEQKIRLAAPAGHSPASVRPSVSRSGTAYRLDGFVVGACNRLAHSACQAVAENPSTIYNPLVLHGDHGLGKTHLLQGLAHALQDRATHQKVKTLSCEEFANLYVQAVRNRNLEQFRAEIRRCHALLIDDLQFLSGKEKTQDEFLHTFDALLNLGRQLVFTCNVHPRELPRLDERLKARLQSGLVARLAPPEFETRAEQLRAKARQRGMELSGSVVELLAMRVERSVRELEGTVCKLGALSAAEGRTPDTELAKVALRELGYLREGPLALDEVLEIVAQRFGQSPDEVRSPKRHAALVRSRHVAMYLAKQLTSHSLAEIGRYFGNRDHSTVLHAVRKVTEQMKREEDLRSEIQALRRSLGR